jgi:hypothetical protein
MKTKLHEQLCNRFEDALDFLDTLPDMIEWAEESGTIHYLVEPEDVRRRENHCLLTGPALMVQLVFQRSEYRNQFITTPLHEELVLYINPKPGNTNA